MASEQINLTVSGMSCSHCTNYVQKTLSAVDGIISAKPDLKTGTVDITFDPTRITSQQVIEALNETPYQVVEK